MKPLPSLQDIQSSPSHSESPLAIALVLLFEQSPILISKLEPQLSSVLKGELPLQSYTDLIKLALALISEWDVAAQSEFISGHPRIGESKNLSNLSANEQGGQGANPTPPAVLARLAHLNTCYEVKYPGLRYITFVNGRSRAAITEEMEDALSLTHSFSTTDPDLVDIVPHQVGSNAWLAELGRAIYDIGRIAESRSNALAKAGA